MKKPGFRVSGGIFGVALLALLVPVHAAAQVGGVDVMVDGGGIIQNEISMALVPGTQPGQPQVLLAAYNDNPFPGGNGVGVSYSIDGGATWKSTQLAFPTSSISLAQLADAFDPTVTADTHATPNPNLFVAHISTDGNLGGVSGLYVHKSTDLGQTWTTPVEVSADGVSSSGPTNYAYRFNDRCQITADRFSGSPNNDNVYIAWIKDRGLYDQNNPPPTPGFAPPSDIYFSYSTDNGQTFSSPAIINDNPGTDLANMPVPRVAADGTVYVSWLDYDVWTGGSGTIWLDKSTDGGVTWGTDQKVTTINLPPINVTDGSANPDARAKGAPVLATSPSNANELYLVYAADPVVPGDEADIFFIRSTDGGVNWSTPPLRLHNDTTTNDQILPWIDVKSNGLIDVAWYDRQNDVGSPPGIPGDVFWDVSLATSVDGGQTFQPEAQLNDLSFSTPAGTWMGEYLGLVVDATHAYVAWSSSISDGAGDIYFDKVTNPVVPTPTPTPVATSVCGTVPETGCRAATPGKSRVVIKNHSTDDRDKFVWVWPRGDASSLADFKDPVNGTATYRICVYDSNVALTQPLMQMNVPPQGTCRTKPCWKATRSTGYRYRDPDLTNDGIKFVRLKAGVTGKARVVVRGKKANLPMPTLPLTTPVTVQLVIDDGFTRGCWQTTYSGTPIRNDVLFFKAKE